MLKKNAFTNPCSDPIATPSVTKQELLDIGGEKVAYLRFLTRDQAQELFTVGLPPGHILYALYAANGMPLALASSLGEVLLYALEENIALEKRN